MANQTIKLTAEYGGNLPAGLYQADRVQLTNTYLDVFPATTQIIDYWERLSSTIGISAASPVDAKTWANFNFAISDNVAAVTTTTFAWHITESIGTGQSFDIWIPAPPEELKTTYSLHLFDAATTNILELEKDYSLVIKPNPSNAIFEISYSIENAKEAKFVVYDITGRLLLSRENINQADIIELDLSNYSNGIYICQFITDLGTFSEKIIKQ